MSRSLHVRLVEDDATLADFTFDTDLDVPALVARLQDLVRPAAHTRSMHEPDDPPGLTGIGRRYLPLAQHLQRESGTHLRLSFGDVETILNQSLPPTARGLHARSWWANTETHSQGRAWLAAGWRVSHIDPDMERVEFRR